MIIDTSAVLAVLMDEKESDQFTDILDREENIRFSVAGYLEAALYIDRNFDEVRRAMLDSFLQDFNIRLEPVTVEQIKIARQALNSFGKGRHKAALNFGDCFTYALAKSYNEPVLFKGNDFSKTDLESVGDRIH